MCVYFACVFSNLNRDNSFQANDDDEEEEKEGEGEEEEEEEEDLLQHT